MPVGLQVLNDNGSLLIDSTYKNMAFLAKGTVNVGSNTSAGGLEGGVSFSNPQNYFPIVFARSTGFVQVSASSFTGVGYHLAQGVTTFDWWAFGWPTAQAHGQGLQVFDENGVCCFDTTYNYLRLKEIIGFADTINYPNTGGVSNIVSRALQTSANRAFAASDPGYQLQVLTGAPVSGGITYRNIGKAGVRLNGSNIESAIFQSTSDLSLPSGVSVNTQAARLPTKILIADISNL